jgi:DNA-binding NarL/FixJ family response regulator
MKPTRVLLADDHALVRAGIRSLLEKMPGIEVVAEASDGRVALELIAQHQPNVVLMDIAMPGLNGLESVARITREFFHVRVLILSMHANEEYVLQALRSGAAGYLLKDGAVPELELAIKAVAAGDTFLSPRISKAVISSYVERVPNHEEPADRLTPRQREILQLIAEGNSTKEIAFHLGISVKTVEAHRAQLMDRLDLHDVPGLVRYAMRRGLVPPESGAA